MRRRGIMGVSKREIPWSGNMLECSIDAARDVNNYYSCVLEIPGGAGAINVKSNSYVPLYRLYVCNSYATGWGYITPNEPYETLYYDDGVYVTITRNIPQGYAYILATGSNRNGVSTFEFLTTQV